MDVAASFLYWTWWVKIFLSARDAKDYQSPDDFDLSTFIDRAQRRQTDILVMPKLSKRRGLIY
jgi:hypothetical protein